MPQSTIDKLAIKALFAGETQPSMNRRRTGHAYEERCMYLITMTTEGRRPLFGTVTGNPEAEEGAEDAPRIVLSPLGAAVENIWLTIGDYHPEIKVLALQMMPDHLHGILFVKKKMPQHLGHIIRGFKSATNNIYKTVHYAAMPSLQNDNTRKHGLLWSIGYNDKILDRRGQLKNWLNYLHDNPRRLLIKRMHKELFRVQRNIAVGDLQFSAIGNRFLLSHPLRIQVQCSRSLNNEQIELRKKYFLELANRGAVLVSPSISPGEKTIMRAAFDAGFPLIILQENGFTNMTKPTGSRFEACAAGKILILAPWEHHNQRLNIKREQCLSLNEMAKTICTSLNK